MFPKIYNMYKIMPIWGHKNNKHNSDMTAGIIKDQLRKKIYEINIQRKAYKVINQQINGHIVRSLNPNKLNV